MKKPVILILTLLLFISCNKKTSQNDITSEDNTNAVSKVEFVAINHSEFYDTIYCDVKMTEGNKKIIFGDIKEPNIKIRETGFDSAYAPVFIESRYLNDKNVIGDISILVLMDVSASIDEKEIKKQKEAIKELKELLPNNKIYFSLMDASVTSSVEFSIAELNYSLDKAAERTRSEKHLYEAILAKIYELSGQNSHRYYPEVAYNQELKDTASPKMLFVLTNGKVRNGDEFIAGGDFFKQKIELTSIIREKILNKEMPNIPIHCIFFGESDMIEDIADEMEIICNTGTENQMKGKFHRAFSSDSIRNIMFKTIDDISADYRLVLLNPAGKTYRGDRTTLLIEIEKGTLKAYGEKEYTYCTPLSPCKVPDRSCEGEIQSTQSVWKKIGIGLLFGALFVLIVYGIMQILIPYIQYRIFKKKYVVPYRRGVSDGSGNELVDERCYFDKKRFEDGDMIVTKCKHIVHWECWEENRNRCPEYGSKNCSTGIHYYNKKQLTDPRNGSYYLPWVLFGMIGGILSWIFFKIIYSALLFNGLVSFLTDVFYPIAHEVLPDEVVDPNIIRQFQFKIPTFLLTGLVLGFFLTFVFCYYIEFRKKTIKVIGILLLRSLIGSLLGFIAFLLSSVIIIIAGKSSNCIWLDWIPWLFFAAAMALSVSYKTEIKFKNALIGGIISVLFSFIVLYLSTFAQEIIGLFSYMLYAAGLGVAIAVVHFISQKYFLHTEGPMKDREIAIYKWMNVSGGFNKVTIGKSIDCVIQINWDDKGKIADKQVELYLENDRPYCKAISEGTILGSGRTLKVGDIIHLTHGTSFIIGNTKFTYVEKDK
ncbi:MAG TPA: hypothetical protein PKW80_10425 [Bacteroidales bacterium]|nr:hypothetical protein [Bacteroidales bacterium]